MTIKMTNTFNANKRLLHNPNEIITLPRFDEKTRAKVVAINQSNYNTDQNGLPESASSYLLDQIPILVLSL